MTVLFSSITVQADLVVMIADSAVTTITGDQVEFSSGKKSFTYQGVGCITTWGERSNGGHIRKLKNFLDNANINPNTHSVTALANLIYEFLTKNFQPKENNWGDVGYHVGGFDKDGKPRLYHIFYGTDRPPAKDEIPDYHFYEHSSPGIMLYNGRNDLAENVIFTLFREISLTNVAVYNPRNQISLIQLGDFIVRFAAELSFEIGPPFYTCLISPRNEIESVTNRLFQPLDAAQIAKALVRLGYGVLEVTSILEDTVRNIVRVLNQKLATSDNVGELLFNSVNFPPVGVLLGELKQFPSVLWISDFSEICIKEEANCWRGAPNLVIEIMSPGNTKIVRRDKFEVYESSGVEEYWMLEVFEEPQARYIEIWRQSNGDSPLPHFERQCVCGQGDDGFQSAVLGVYIDQESVETMLGCYDATNFKN